MKALLTPNHGHGWRILLVSKGNLSAWFVTLQPSPHLLLLTSFMLSYHLVILVLQSIGMCQVYSMHLPLSPSSVVSKQSNSNGQPDGTFPSSPPAALLNESSRKTRKDKGHPRIPSEDLGRLINWRPAESQSARRNYFIQKFNEHSRIKKLVQYINPIQLEPLTTGWTALRNDLKDTVSAQKMRSVIKQHFDELGVDAEVQEAVEAHWQRHLGRIRNDVRLSKLKQNREKYNQFKQNHSKLVALSRTRKLKGEGPLTFEEYMKIYNITIQSTDVSSSSAAATAAKDIEFKSRVFRHEYGEPATSAASHALRKYLDSKGFTPLQIIATLNERSEFLKKQQRKRHNDKKAKELAQGKEEKKLSDDQEHNDLSTTRKSAAEEEIAPTTSSSSKRRFIIDHVLQMNPDWWHSSHF